MESSYFPSKNSTEGGEQKALRLASLLNGGAFPHLGFDHRPKQARCIAKSQSRAVELQIASVLSVTVLNFVDV